MVCWNELWPYWENCTTLWDYQGKFHLQIGLLYHMNSIKFHNPTTDCTYLAAFLILNSGEVWSASSPTCRKWRNALERRSCARNDWRCWTKRLITEAKKGSQTWIWDGEWGNMQEEPAIRSINIQEAFDMPLASPSHDIWLELTVLCLIAEARCVWCTYVLLLRQTMESIHSPSPIRGIFHDYHYPLDSRKRWRLDNGTINLVGSPRCLSFLSFELQFVVGFIMCHSKFLLVFSKSGPCNHHNIIITIGKSQAFLRWTLVVLPYSSAHLLPQFCWLSSPCFLGQLHMCFGEIPINVCWVTPDLLLKSPVQEFLDGFYTDRQFRSIQPFLIILIIY